ncbi:hypothetical protein CANARDRAFT_7886 [[Candida] arabinofermentans NRRL YB-2248]|uniref:Uncharacterized protein n=1 Tax=[Candida] arabinofermentans NRRL YB-2248 TaxID=983967 RepID=A0A1E4T0L1_9ASCO|nr:hypothetical protein CANARDRAFT_7886 [[Candida] arabinofermentans NRRL YB-2248]
MNLISKQAQLLKFEMKNDSFENNFWTLDYKTGYNKLSTILNDEGYKSIDDLFKFFKEKIQYENVYCQSLHEKYLSKKINFMIFDHNGDLEKDEVLISGFSSSVKLILEIEQEAKLRKRYTILLEREILLPLNDFRRFYKSKIKSESEKITRMTQQYEMYKKYFNAVRLNYRSKTRELNRYSGLKIKQSLELYENLNRDRKLRLLESEPLNYVISPKVQFSREEFILILRTSILKHSVEEEHKHFFKKSTKQRVSTGSQITQLFINGITSKINSIRDAEAFGQFLIDHDFLRNITTKENKFANITDWKFEWLLKSFDLSDITPPFEIKLKQKLDVDGSVNGYSLSPASSVNSETSSLANVSVAALSQVGATAAPIIRKVTNGSVQSNESDDFVTIKNLKFESDQLERDYLDATIKLDELQSNLEEAMFESYQMLNSLEFEKCLAIERYLNKYIDYTFRSPTAESNVSNYKNYNNTYFIKTDEESQRMYELLMNLKQATEAMDPKKDMKSTIDLYKTGSYLSKVEIFVPLKGKKVAQLFGINLSTLTRLEDMPMPRLVLELLTKIRDLVTEDLKDIKWWLHPVIDYKTVFKIKADLNMLVRSDSNFYNPADGIMTKEYRKKFSAQIESILSSERFDKSIQANYASLVFGKPPELTEVRLMTMFALLKCYFLQLPESLIPAKFIPSLNAIYANKLSENNTSEALLNEVLSRLGDNIVTLNGLVLLWEAIIDTGADNKSGNNDDLATTLVNSEDSTEGIYNFISDFFIEAIVHVNLDEDDYAKHADQPKFNMTYSIRLIKDLFHLKSNIEVEIEARNRERKLAKKGMKAKAKEKGKQREKSLEPSSSVASITTDQTL